MARAETPCQIGHFAIKLHRVLDGAAQNNSAGVQPSAMAIAIITRNVGFS